MKVSLHIIFTVVAATAAFFLFAVGKGILAQYQKVATGNQGMIGERGLVIKELSPEGQVRLHGEIWKAVSIEKIRQGQQVEVTAVNGLTLIVKRIEPEKPV
jgi:membrane-bound serine protease (ClpP class)